MKKSDVIRGLQLSTEQVKRYQKQKTAIKQQTYECIETEVQTTLTENGFNISKMTVQEQLIEYYAIKYDSPEINAIVYNSFRKYNNSNLTMDDIKQDIYLMFLDTKIKNLKTGYFFWYVKIFANNSCLNAINQYRLYPDRFISIDRILSGSLPNIEFNVADIEPFVQAQREILGEGHVYPMLAYSKLKTKAAFKMYARAVSLDFEIANIIAVQLDKFEKEYHYAAEDEKDLINVYDYVSEEYREIIEGSKAYQGIEGGKTRHACGYLLYQGDIREEIGLIWVKTESTGKDTLCTLMDGKTADKYGYVKNDLLKVDVVKIIDRTFKRIGKPIPTEKELYTLTNNDSLTWGIYENGVTICINQIEREATQKKAMKYAPKNISEIAAFVAAIRSSFKSMVSTFLNRETFAYGISSFDEVIQTTQLPQSFILYQEMIMSALVYAGFPVAETYTIIKSISKKKQEVINLLKDRFIAGFKKQITNREKNGE